MEIKKIEIPLRNGKFDFKIISFLDSSKLLVSKGDFINKITDEIKNLKGEDFAGYSNKEEFISCTKYYFFDGENDVKYSVTPMRINNIIDNIIQPIKKIKSLLSGETFNIYVFPTNDSITRNELGGVWGFLVKKNIIYLYLNPVKNFEVHLRSTILHELAHNFQNYYGDNMTLFEHIVADGLAEHFQEKYLEGNRNSFTKAISKNEAKIILGNLKDDFNKSMVDFPKLHLDLFFGSKKYVSGTGYTIGYYLIESFLKNKKGLVWKDVLNKNPEFFKECSFFRNTS